MTTAVLPDPKSDKKAYHHALVAFVVANPELNTKQIREATGCTPQSLATARKAIRRQVTEAPKIRIAADLDWAKFCIRSYGQSTENLIRRTLARLAAGPKVVIRPVVRDIEEADHG